MRACEGSCQPGHGQHVGAGVHHDEEEDAREVEPLQVGVVLHHQVHQVGHLLHQDGVKGDQQLHRYEGKDSA